MDNLAHFGRFLENIRENLSLTKVEVSRLSGLNTETIRRIEYGEVSPKFETLDRLSGIYKVDVVQLFMEHRLKDYSHFHKLEDNVESLIDRDDVTSLPKVLLELESFYKGIDDTSFYKVSVKQLIFLIKGIISYKHDKEYEKSLSILIEGIRITTPSFSLDNYKYYNYNPTELRVLMNIAFVVNRLGETRKYKEMLKFCVYKVDPNDVSYPKLCHNLAGAYRRNKNYESSLYYSDLAIKTAQEQRNYNGLNILFYGKGLSEFYLGLEDYKKSFETCFYLCEAFGQLELKETYLSNIKNILGVEMDL